MRKIMSKGLFQIVMLITVLQLSVMEAAVAAGEEEGAGGAGFAIPLYKDKHYLHVIHEGRSVKVQRVQDPDYQLRGYFAKTIRKCPPFCIVDMAVDPRVKTIGEIEMFEFMENQLRDGKGLLIDARTPSWFAKETIPGSVNVPFSVLSKKASEAPMIEALESFGATQRGEVGAFTKLWRVGEFQIVRI